MPRTLTDDQLIVLRHCANAKGDGWFYAISRYSGAASGLARRGLIESRLDHNRDRRIKITEAGKLELQNAKP